MINPNYNLSSLSPPSSYHVHHHDHPNNINHDHHDRPQLDHSPQPLFFPNYQTPSSSSVSSSAGFLNIAQDHQTYDYYHNHMNVQQQQQEVENHGPCSGSHDPEVEKKPNKALKITLWKNRGSRATSGSITTMKFEDHHDDEKQPAAASAATYPEADHFSSNSTTPIRVCADCSTTKTPLWRSGPKGPKSLCNACGIRQRKARRAMAAAAAAANGTGPPTYDHSTVAPLKIKMQNKDNLKNNNNGPFKKRCKLNGSTSAVAESSHDQNLHAVQKKSVFEDFLLNLSKNLAFQRVFPQDEKDAAILLMAISCGLVHG